MREPIATWNPSRDCWETSQVDLLSGLSDVYSGTFPNSVSMRRSSLFERPMLAPRTSGSASSSLPTPTAADSGASGGSTPSDVTLTDAVVRTELGTRENPRHMLPTPTVTNAAGNGENNRGDLLLPGVAMAPPENPDVAAGGERRLAAPREAEGGRARADARGRGRTPAADARRGGGPEGDRQTGVGAEVEDGAGVAHERGARSGEREWGAYEPAIRRWERALGRVDPAPTNPDGKGGAHRLAPQFVEWMMGLPAGHVTSPEIGITRNEQLKALGNGVVPQQAHLALSLAWPRLADVRQEAVA